MLTFRPDTLGTRRLCERDRRTCIVGSSLRYCAFAVRTRAPETLVPVFLFLPLHAASVSLVIRNRNKETLRSRPRFRLHCSRTCARGRKVKAVFPLTTLLSCAILLELKTRMQYIAQRMHAHPLLKLSHRTACGETAKGETNEERRVSHRATMHR